MVARPIRMRRSAVEPSRVRRTLGTRESPPSHRSMHGRSFGARWPESWPRLSALAGSWLTALHRPVPSNPPPFLPSVHELMAVAGSTFRPGDSGAAAPDVFPGLAARAPVAGREGVHRHGRRGRLAGHLDVPFSPMCSNRQTRYSAVRALPAMVATARGSRPPVKHPKGLGPAGVLGISSR
jgi:hypothetical protein